MKRLKRTADDELSKRREMNEDQKRRQRARQEQIKAEFINLKNLVSGLDVDVVSFQQAISSMDIETATAVFKKIYGVITQSYADLSALKIMSDNRYPEDEDLGKFKNW